MGWLKRLFGREKPENPKASIAGTAKTKSSGGDDIPPERVGLEGEYDQSGLAKRVALAFDEDPDLEDEDRLWVAQTGGTVVLKGTVSSQSTLDKMVSVARGVKGATAVDTDQVKTG
ncbi:MAG: BON domain-containing protein [Cyanophyceae cyanobacterium]